MWKIECAAVVLSEVTW